MLPARPARLLAVALILLAACGHRAAVGAVPSASTAGEHEVRLLALGDSFTAGTGSSPAQSFPARLVERFRARGGRVVLRNLGVNGYTTGDLLRAEMPEVAGFAPTVVTLAIGANDIVRGRDLEEYRASVREILAGLRAAGVLPRRVVALPQPDWSRSPAAAYFGEPDEIAARIESFNAVLRSEATAWGARYEDLFPLMQREARAGLVAPDGLHPSAQAYDEWAEALAGAVWEAAR